MLFRMLTAAVCAVLISAAGLAQTAAPPTGPAATPAAPAAAPADPGAPTPRTRRSRTAAPAPVVDPTAPSTPAAAPAARPTPPAALPAGTRVNLNTATAAQLDALPGVGKARLKAIMDERAKAPFKDWDDFDRRMQHSSVNKGVRAKIKDYSVF